MKKIAGFLIMLLICFSFAGCNKKTDGTLAAGNTEKSKTQNTATGGAISEETVSYDCDAGSISLCLPDGWSHKIVKYKETKKDKTFGITFWKGKTKKNKISVQYMEHFGVCGTGLKTKEISLNGMNCEAGYYNGKPYWEYIYVKENKKFIILNFLQNENWWTDNGEQAMEILDTLTLETV